MSLKFNSQKLKDYSVKALKVPKMPHLTLAIKKAKALKIPKVTKITIIKAKLKK
jgi:hypothetical protein